MCSQISFFHKRVESTFKIPLMGMLEVAYHHPVYANYSKWFALYASLAKVILLQVVLELQFVNIYQDISQMGVDFFFNCLLKMEGHIKNYYSS